ncbi:hypothetical protein HHL08_14300 [Sphingobium sp. AR-3-1]|uniref:Phage tail protein n=1 Tax=Sphingobium psychrophilum TaxID=2728834 RepID=A0A7X9ZSS0_9SPHN|nr:phage tail tube protein [Sphingobium psychrophilum]NML11303.1 hypothetical protein [Sphingobium psychrophilum]
MSYPTTIKGQKVALQLGDGASTEVFTTVCGITTKGLQRTRAVNDSEVWDCTDPDALPLTEREMGAGDWTITGEGQAVAAELDRIEEAFEAAANWQIVFFGTGTTITRTYRGNAIMTDLNLGAVNGQKASISLTLSGNGELTKLP